MDRNAVYRLKAIFDDPKFDGFASEEEGVSFLGHETVIADFQLGPLHGRTCQVPRLSAVWKPLKVIGKVRRFNDYPCLDASIPAFSERAVDALRDLLEPNGELLPLVSELGQYYAYNTTTLVDALDLGRSQLEAFAEHYEFFSEKIEGLSIFRIPDDCIDIYVTDRFAARVRDCGLQGFNLAKLWPLPPGVDWRKLYREQLEKQYRQGLPEGQMVKGNTMVIRLYLTGKGGKATKYEREYIEVLLNQLDGLLVDVDSTAPAVGSLEGNDFGVKGECRLFLSCPDADALVERLRPWLDHLPWEAKFRVLKRYGPYLDYDAKEEYVEDLKNNLSR